MRTANRIGVVLIETNWLNAVAVKTEEAYNRFKLENPSVPLKENIYAYNGFKWQHVLDPNNKIYYGEENEIEITKPNCKSDVHKYLPNIYIIIISISLQIEQHSAMPR